MPTKFLTREGFQKLQEELDHLRTVKRLEVAERLHEAMEGGELIENEKIETVPGARNNGVMAKAAMK